MRIKLEIKGKHGLRIKMQGEALLTIVALEKILKELKDNETMLELEALKVR